MSTWLSKYFITGDDFKNATHYYTPIKTYLKVPNHEKQDFWQNYFQTVLSNVNPGIQECTTNLDHLPLAFDLSFKFNTNEVHQNENSINELDESIDTYVTYIISVVQTLLPQYFEYSETKSEYIAVYLKREVNKFYWDNNTVYFDAKIIFPYARMRKEFIKTFYHLCYNQMKIHNGGPEKYLKVIPINGFDTLLRPCDGELYDMFGLTPISGKESLSFHEAYGVIKDTKSILPIERIFNPGLHADVIQNNLSQDLVVQLAREYGLNYFLPLFFSIHYSNIPLTPKNGMILISSEPDKQVTMSDIKNAGDSLDKMQKVRQILTMVSILRTNEKSFWLDVGQAIYSVDRGDEGLKLWKWFTAQSDDLDEDDCDEYWPTLAENNTITIATLEFYAEKDNPVSYGEYRSLLVQKALSSAIQKQSHTAIAEAFHAFFPHKFVCASFTNSEWYTYENHRWIRSDGTYMLQWTIIKNFIPKIEEIRAKIANEMLGKDQTHRKQCENDITLIGQLIAQLEKNNFKENLCRELKVFYYDKNFNTFKDKNVFFTGTPNGVIDVRSGKALFREGKPQDYITKSTRYAFDNKLHINHPLVRECLAYIRKVYRNANVNRFFWKYCSSFLKSGNADKLFVMFIGEGDNSKSMVILLLSYALGSYLCHLPTSVITGKDGAADQATPALISATGAKVVILDEPNENETIRSGTVKKLTGNDMLFLRDLFQKGAEITDTFISFKIIVVANKVLTINDTQRAIWQRTTLIDHTSRWSLDSVPETEEEQFLKGVFPLDNDFNLKLPRLAPAFLWLMTHFYEDYAKEGLKKPIEVQESTEKFRIASNYYIQFTKEKVKPVLNLQGMPDTNAVVTLIDLFNAFRNWFKTEQIKTKMPDKATFKQNIEIIWKEKADANERWLGYRIEMPEAKPTMGGLLSL